MGIFFWNLYMSKLRGEIERMDAEFYEHIKRNRVDPSKQTMQNRLPDYYVGVGALTAVLRAPSC